MDERKTTGAMNGAELTEVLSSRRIELRSIAWLLLATINLCSGAL